MQRSISISQPSVGATRLASTGDARTLHLRAGGTSVVLDLHTPGVPAIVHWGQDLGDASRVSLDSLAIAAVPQRVSGGLDTTARLTLLPQQSQGWLGTPGLSGHFADGAFSSRLIVTEIRADASSAVIDAADAEVGLTASIQLEVTPAGLFRQRITLRNDGETGYLLDDLAPRFPVPDDADELLDTTGRHLRERSPQRHSFTIGTHLRQSRRGRPGADATLLLAAGRHGFGFERGVVHAVHLAWSGNHRLTAERTPTGDSALSAGELLESGEIVLAPGAAYSTPWAIGSWGDGLTELSSRFHRELRARPQHPVRPRPVTLNTWEAVYFDHDLAHLRGLADAAAGVGVERYVLDDGWFLGRRDDTAGLGDWYVDRAVWPDGLAPLIDHVRSLGMEFGLWVEPEMVNADSDLARNHPDWILHARRDLPPSGRQQQVLDLANPDAYAYVAHRLLALLDENDIAYLKWDHNRDVVDAGSGPAGRPRVHDNVLALYRLMGELKAAHPGLEIESCASGGARVDLGILDFTDRVWASDCLDPIERLQIQKYTGLLVPPELMGAHLTSPTVHSTDRSVPLELSAGVAVLGHFGIEWDLTELNEFALAGVAEWVTLYKRLRRMIAEGTIVHADLADAAVDVRGCVARDGSAAVFTISQIESSVTLPGGRIRFPGLDPDRLYRIAALAPRDAGGWPAQSPLAWIATPVELTGRQLGTAGLRAPVQFPQRLTMVELTALD